MKFFEKLVRKIMPIDYILEKLQNNIPDGVIVITFKGIFYYRDAHKASKIFHQF